MSSRLGVVGVGVEEKFDIVIRRSVSKFHLAIGLKISHCNVLHFAEIKVEHNL